MIAFIGSIGRITHTHTHICAPCTNDTFPNNNRAIDNERCSFFCVCCRFEFACDNMVNSRNRIGIETHMWQRINAHLKMIWRKHKVRASYKCLIYCPFWLRDRQRERDTRGERERDSGLVQYAGDGNYHMIAYFRIRNINEYVAQNDTHFFVFDAPFGMPLSIHIHFIWPHLMEYAIT